MDTFPTVGEPYEVEWVTIAEPNPADDTDSSPLAVGEQAKGAAIFDREEGIWVGATKSTSTARRVAWPTSVQVYEFDPGSQTITLIYQSASGKTLENPDNVVIVPKTGDIFLQEDSDPEHCVRGLTPDGKSTTSPARSPTTPSPAAAASARTARFSSSTSRARVAAPRRVLQTRTR
jgi:hypothetical protein